MPCQKGRSQMKDYTKDRGPEMLEPFFPNEMFRHTIVSCFLIVLDLIAVILFPLPCKLVNKPDTISWFLLPFYKLSKLVQNENMFILILAFCALLFISWPFLARVKKHKPVSVKKEKDIDSCRVLQIPEHRNLWQRPIPFTVVIITIISLIQLCFMKR
jgi:quinol-cytochrome oxidoreductase complex cytochrome b subunit